MTTATRTGRLARNARQLAVNAAIQDEFSRFHKAIQGGTVVILTTHSGDYQVLGMTEDFWAFTYKVGHVGNSLYQSSWCLANDGRWADLLRQAGVLRNPLFA